MCTRFSYRRVCDVQPLLKYLLASFLTYVHHHQDKAPQALVSVAEEAGRAEWSDKLYNATRSNVDSKLSAIWKDKGDEQVYSALLVKCLVPDACRSGCSSEPATCIPKCKPS